MSPTYTFFITTAIGVPQLRTEMVFSTDQAAIGYAQSLAMNFAGVSWFLAVEIVKDLTGEHERHVGTVTLPKPKAEFKAAN